MNSIVEQIKERLPITDVLGGYITLTPAGKQFKAKCPFHNERTASFSISPDRGLYYCFGCGARGDIVTFVEQFEGVDFNGALKILADKAGVTLNERDRHADDRAPVYEFLEKTTIRYQNELARHPEALRYLKGRGLTDETIASFRIGYAPDEWRFVANECTTGTAKSIAERAGLIKLGEEGSGKGPYDRFRRRIMFPLSDASGRVVGFSGRLFPDEAPREGGTPPPKYLNSPETEVFQKSRVLFGFDKAKYHIKRNGFAILVEGQMDLIMSHQMGFRNTVATSGTAVSDQSKDDPTANLSVVSRLASTIFLAFDGDSAGQKALERAALVALSMGMNPKVVALPDTKDPADFLLGEGPEAWKALLKDGAHFLVHQARALRVQKLSPHLLVKALREHIFPYLSRVPSPIEQELYTEAVGKELGIDAVQLAREHARFVAEQPSLRTPTEIETQPRTPKIQISLRERLAGCRMQFDASVLEPFITTLETLSVGGHSFGTLSIEQDRLPIVLATVEQEYGALSEEARTLAYTELFEKARDEFYREAHALISHDLRDAEGRGDEEKVEETLKLLMEINRLRQTEV